jgi:hypothetical protein
MRTRNLKALAEDYEEGYDEAMIEDLAVVLKEDCKISAPLLAEVLDFIDGNEVDSVKNWEIPDKMGEITLTEDDFEEIYTIINDVWETADPAEWGMEQAVSALEDIADQKYEQWRDER